MRRGNDEPVVVQSLDDLDRLEQAPDLRREDEGVARARREPGADASLGETESVVRGGVEVADTELPGGVEGCPRVLVRHLAIQVSELGTAERQPAYIDPGLAASIGAHPGFASNRDSHVIFICYVARRRNWFLFRR